MGTIKLDKDEMLKIAYELSVLKDQINNILNKTQETENVLRREKSVSTYSQKRKLSGMQDLAYNLVREFDKISDNFYQAARAYESSEDRINNLVNINENNDIKNIIAINSMENTYFNSYNSKSKEKEGTTFDKLKELTQEGWQLFKDYCGLYISAMDFMKDVCDNIDTLIDGYITNHEEFFAEFNAENPTLSIIFAPLQGGVGLGDSALKFAKDMTFGLGGDILGMLSKEYKGLLENPEETLIGNLRAVNMFRAIVCPMTKEEQELQSQALSGMWAEIKNGINTDIINGNPYTATRFVSDIAINIGSLFFGAGELRAATGVKKADNVVDGVRVIDKVSDAGRLTNGEKWFNYFNKAYGAENVEWTSKVLDGRIPLRENIFYNIEKSRLARESSNFKNFKGFTEADRIKQFNLANCRSIMKNELNKFRNKIIGDGYQKNISKICSTVDAGRTSIRGKGASGIWTYNPTIEDFRGINPKNFCKSSDDYINYYRELLSDDYIRNLPDDFFIGKNKSQIRDEMGKLRENINRVKQEAIHNPNVNLNKYGEPSFEYGWNVENCAEVWAVRDAIFKGAKFDDIVIRTEKLKGGFATPCRNCERTFADLYNIDY